MIYIYTSTSKSGSTIRYRTTTGTPNYGGFESARKHSSAFLGCFFDCAPLFLISGAQIAANGWPERYNMLFF